MTRMTDRGTAVLASTALVASLLAGCNGDPTDPTTSTTASSTASTASSTTTGTSGSTTSTSTTSTSAYVPVKPKFPSVARKQTDEGAVAFVEHYWASMNYAVTKPDASALNHMGTKECAACTAMQESILNLESESHRYGSPPADAEIELIYQIDGTASLLVRLAQIDVQILDHSGEQVEEVKSPRAKRIVNLKWNRGWRINEILES